jgi:integrase
MTRHRTLNDADIAKLPTRKDRYTVADPELRGLYIRVTPRGTRTFITGTRDPHGKQVWSTLGSFPVMGIDLAREKAKAALLRLRRQGNATFAEIADEYIKRKVEPKGVRTQAEIERCLRKYILPHWGHREFTSIKRRDIATLLDCIQDAHGARMADINLTIIRAIANHYATRSDNYISPVVKGMKRDTALPRDRILDDDEIRLLWNTAEGTYGDICKLALLTGQRRDMLACMKWDDIVDGVWQMPDMGKGAKGHGGDLALPKLALDIIEARPRLVSNPFVFPGRGNLEFRAFAACKARLDKKLKIEPWRLHDLRRTARSLMPRAGIQPHIAERVLGHIQPGVAGTYDRHSYDQEKGHALAALAGLIERIIDPQQNVVPLRKRRKA